MIDLEELLEEPAERFVNFWRKHAVSILLILIFNVLIVIVLMSMSLRTYLPSEMRPVAIEFDDPSAREALEKLYKEYEELVQANNTAPIRNIVVDATKAHELNAGLADDKHANANEIYDEMSRLRAELAEYKEAREQRENNATQGEVDLPPTTQPPTKKDNLYQGPSVLSYVLDGRSSVALPVPAYRCQTGGIVVVIIHVNKTGAVINAGINKQESQESECLHEAALKAAYRSRFNASPDAPELQVGMITYQFVRQ